MADELPGYHVRPQTHVDVDAVTELIAAVEFDVLGEELVTRADTAALWAVDGFDLERDSVGIYRDDRLVAACLIYDRKAEVNVHPSATGQGLGTWLRVWSERRARAAGRPTIGQTVPDRNPAAGRILRDAGYQRS